MPVPTPASLENYPDDGSHDSGHDSQPQQSHKTAGPGARVAGLTPLRPEIARNPVVRKLLEAPDLSRPPVREELERVRIGRRIRKIQGDRRAAQDADMAAEYEQFLSRKREHNTAVWKRNVQVRKEAMTRLDAPTDGGAFITQLDGAAAEAAAAVTAAAAPQGAAQGEEAFDFPGPDDGGGGGGGDDTGPPTLQPPAPPGPSRRRSPGRGRRSGGGSVASGAGAVAVEVEQNEQFVRVFVPPGDLLGPASRAEGRACAVRDVDHTVKPYLRQPRGARRIVAHNCYPDEGDPTSAMSVRMALPALEQLVTWRQDRSSSSKKPSVPNFGPKSRAAALADRRRVASPSDFENVAKKQEKSMAVVREKARQKAALVKAQRALLLKFSKKMSSYQREVHDNFERILGDARRQGHVQASKALSLLPPEEHGLG